MTAIVKYSKYITWALSIIGGIFFILIFSKGDDAFTNSVDLQQSLINPYIIFSYILTIVPALMLAIFSVWFFITHPKQGKRALIGIGIFALVLIIGWAAADGTLMKGIEDMADETMTRVSGMSLYVFYIMGFSTIAAILFGEMYKVFKK